MLPLSRPPTGSNSAASVPATRGAARNSAWLLGPAASVHAALDWTDFPAGRTDSALDISLTHLSGVRSGSRRPSSTGSMTVSCVLTALRARTSATAPTCKHGTRSRESPADLGDASGYEPPESWGGPVHRGRSRQGALRARRLSGLLQRACGGPARRGPGTGPGARSHRHSGGARRRPNERSRRTCRRAPCLTGAVGNQRPLYSIGRSPPSKMPSTYRAVHVLGIDNRSEIYRPHS